MRALLHCCAADSLPFRCRPPYHAHLAFRHAVWAAEVDLKRIHTHSLTALNDLIPSVPEAQAGMAGQGRGVQSMRLIHFDRQ
jgi:hypothetical protein